MAYIVMASTRALPTVPWLIVMAHIVMASMRALPTVPRHMQQQYATVYLRRGCIFEGSRKSREEDGFTEPAQCLRPCNHFESCEVDERCVEAVRRRRCERRLTSCTLIPHSHELAGCGRGAARGTCDRDVTVGSAARTRAQISGCTLHGACRGGKGALDRRVARADLIAVGIGHCGRERALWWLTSCTAEHEFTGVGRSAARRTYDRDATVGSTARTRALPCGRTLHSACRGAKSTLDRRVARANLIAVAIVHCGREVAHGLGAGVCIARLCLSLDRVGARFRQAACLSPAAAPGRQRCGRMQAKASVGMCFRG